VINTLKRIHHSNFISRIYQRIPVLKRMVDKIYGIYTGRGDLMTNRIYWLIYSVFRYFRQDFILLRRSQVRRIGIPIDDMCVIYIIPDRIEFIIVSSNHKNEGINRIEDGHWDLRKEKFEDTKNFTALREHFTRGTPLSDNRYQEVDRLFNDIRDKGYKTQKELGNPDISDEIKVAIDRNGRFLLENGEIRLAIAKILELGSIPVIITRRHYQWAKFRKEVYLYSQQQPKGAYQPLIHPDLQKMPSHRKEDRWELMVGNLPLSSGTLLDIGANWGYFCHKFEDLGFDCYAVECNYRWQYFMKKLRDVENKKFEIIQRSVFDIKRKKYDIVLALSIFHHFLRSKVLYDKLTRLLGELDMKVMFFEPHETGHGFKDAYIDYSEIEFVNYIIENSCLNRYKLLGKGERGRNMYLLTR